MLTKAFLKPDQSQKQVIDNIRKTRFGIDLATNNISEEIRAYIEDSKKFKDAAARLASELHTERPHFILELIQNADDNDYEETTKPMLKFIKQEDKIILQNNEKGLKEENVLALCGIGETTKKNKTMGYIGEKGIGFKSVFMVTDEPHIYSNGFQFKFKYDEENPRSIIIPHWIDGNPPDYVNSEQTNIILPLKAEIKDEILKKIDNFDPYLLLFLRKLRCIEIEDEINNKRIRVERYDNKEKVKIIHLKGEDFWHVVKSPEPLKVPPYIQEKKREGITETEIVLAFPLKSDGSADISQKQDVFVFLPVRSYGFKFIIQADFLVPPSREDIHKDESDKSWNKWLRDNIANVFLQAVEDFKQDEKLKKTFYNYIPLTNEITDTFFVPVVEKIQQGLCEAQCILTESNNWLKPKEVFRADNDIRMLIPNDDLKRFFGKEYISHDIKVNKQIFDFLGVPSFGFEQLVQFLQNEEWLKKQSDEWFTKLYVYFNNQKLEEEQIQKLKKLKIVQLESNELASIIEGPIFFPLDKKGDYGFEKELRILKRTIFEPKEKETKDAVREFLKKIGIQDAFPYEIIEHHILPIYESEEWKKKDSNTLLGYIRYIKDNLDTYEKESDKQLNANKKYWEKKTEPLERLKKSLYIRINNTVDGNNYDLPQNIYLPKTFGNKNDLETLFEGIEDVSFVHKEYIDAIIKKYRELKKKEKKGKKKGKTEIRKKREEEIEKWRNFFVKIGVNEGLKVVITNDTYLTWDEKRKLRNDNGFTDEEITDYSLLYLKEILEKLGNDIPEKKRKKSELLLTLLEKQWTYLSKFTKLIYEWKYYSWYTKSADSSWLRMLKITQWLSTTKNTFVKPSEVFMDKPEIKELLGDSVPYLSIDIENVEFIKDLGINSEANIGGVINNLKRLNEQKCKDISLFEKLYDFLNKKYDGNEYTIKNAFRDNKLIYLPETIQIYFNSQQVLWKDVSEIFGENRGYLEKHYPKLKSFFVEKLGVSEKPTPKDYANVLEDLSKKEKVEENDEKIILKIYNELNEYLNPEIYEDLISKKDWWKEFIKKPIFWTDKNAFWKNDNNVFVNNNQELYKLFKDTPKIAFLKLPENYYPKLQHFIKEAGISYLTRVVKTKLEICEEEIIEENLTKQIKKFVPYILRYVYYSENKTYNKLKKNGTFAQLKKLCVYSVDTLLVEYIVNDVCELYPNQNAILYNGVLYIKKDCLEEKDILAVEFSKLFGEMRGLDDFLISLFDRWSEDRIQRLLKVKGIQDLPDEEKKWFMINGDGNTDTSTIGGEGTGTHTIGGEGTGTHIIGGEGVKYIGKCGEEYVMKFLKDVLHKEYSNGEVKETEDGFTIVGEGKEYVKVQWLNKNGDHGVGYDIKVIKDGNEEFIEVKSTITDDKDWFYISRKQWELMKEKGDKFYIYRVYNAGTKEEKLLDIPNPYKKWEEGKLIANPIYIQL